MIFAGAAAPIARARTVVCVEAPTARSAERAYALEWVLRDQLGLEYRVVPGVPGRTRLSLSDGEGQVVMPDVFLPSADRGWLTEATLPALPLAIWYPGTAIPGTLDRAVPVVFGEVGAPDCASADPGRLPLDIFGTAFYMLSRYEEIACTRTDEHDRFPAAAAVAYRAGFLHRPLLDEYVNILADALVRTWPGLRLTRPGFSCRPTHDVDVPFLFRHLTPAQALRRTAREVSDWLRRRPGGGPAVAAHYFRPPVAGLRQDPYETFPWIMDRDEEAGCPGTFYFMASGVYRLSHPAVLRLIQTIRRRGHFVGVHPAYEAHGHPDVVAHDADAVRAACREAGVTQEAIGARMHFLRWRAPSTWHAFCAAGLAHDATMGYADNIGFRAGTCHDFPAFDATLGQRLPVVARPLVVMECTVTDGKYMGLGAGQDALDVVRAMRSACQTVGGPFTFLWHNTRVVRPDERRLFVTALQG